MGTTFKQLYNKLESAIDVVPASVCKDIINSALRDIYDERDWGFLWTEGFIRTPTLITGFASVTKYSNVVTLDATTKALINVIITEDVPFDERQVKFYGTNKVDKALFYNIVSDSYDTLTGTFQIDPIYFDDSNIAIKLDIFKVYYTAPYYIFNGNPIIDFRRFAYVFSPNFNRRLILDKNLDELNKLDPQRTNFSYPQYLVGSGIDSNGNQLYELNPIPKTETVLRVRYLRNGSALKNDSDLIPDNIISQELILARAKIRAYEWVAANQGKLDSVKSTTPFFNLIAMLNNRNNLNSYPVLLSKAEKKDEELFPQAYLGDFSSCNYFDDIWGYYGFDFTLPHDSFGDTLVIDATSQV